MAPRSAYQFVAISCIVLAALGPTLVAAAGCTAGGAGNGFSNCLQMSRDYVLGWNYTDEVITFAVVVTGAPGWVGAGISESGTMAGADIMMVSRNQSSSTGFTATDNFGVTNGRPQLDPQQDVELVEASVSPKGETRAVFKRRLQTCDTRDVTIRPGLATYIIWAHGDVDPEYGLPQYHGANRGTKVAMLIPGNSNNNSNSTAQMIDIGSAPKEDDNKTQTLDVRMKVDVPSTMTNYLCTHFVLPNDTKYQIVEYEAFHTPLIHHMILYGCKRQPEKMLQNYECFEMDENCGQFLIGWAPGTDIIEFPPAVGIPFGGSDFPTYVSLQVHYNNPDNLEGQVDNSGLRVHYTSHLRKYDAGYLVLGQNDLTIPPGQPSFSTPPNVCPSTCTSQFSGPLSLMSSDYHMHLIGKAAVTRVIRNGTELPPLGQVTHYSFDRQVPSFIPQESRTLLPGDTLITTCTYDSTSRENVTKYGHSTTDEMCFNFLLYYPLQKDIDTCITGDGGQALCTSAQRAEGLAGGEGKKPSKAQLQEYVEKGWLVNSTMPQFKPYSEFEGCKQVTASGK